MNEDWEKACWTIAGFILGVIGSEIRNWMARRQSRFDAVVERYVTEVRNLDDPDIRLLAMQRAGVASLTVKNITKFISDVLDRGCVHPYRNTVIDGIIPESQIPVFILEATQNDVLLSDKFAVFEYLRKGLVRMEDTPKTKSHRSDD